MIKVIAIVGISGVGKSTLIRQVQARQPLLHLQASDLIKAEQLRQRSNASSSEELRLGPVLDNQQLLISGFFAAIVGFAGLIVFDGHAVIFGESTATEIPSTVFGRIGCQAIIVIEAEPTTIRAQRMRDVARPRPDVTEAELARQQAHAKDVAAKIAAEFAIPFHCIASGDGERLSATLFGLAEGSSRESRPCDV